MKVVLLVLFTFVFSVVLSKKPEDPAPGVIDVTSSNQATVFAKDTAALVEFYAPWCGHCKNLAPAYAQLGAAMNKAKPDGVVVAKVNCVQEKTVCSKYGVSGYPTLKYFPAGKTDPEDYKGGRTADDLVKFINDKTGANLFIPKDPSFVEDLTESTFDKVALEKGKVALVMFFAPWCGHCKTLKPKFEKLGKAFTGESDIIIAKVDVTKNRGLGDKYGIKGFPTLKWITKDNKVEDANVGRSLPALLKYVNEKAGSFRTETGLLDDKAALYEPLTTVVKKFLGAKAEERTKLVAEGEKLLESLPSNYNKRATGYYVRAMKKILKRGDDFVGKEKTRLEGLLKSSSVSQTALDSFQTRLNVLKQF